MTRRRSIGAVHSVIFGPLATGPVPNAFPLDPSYYTQNTKISVDVGGPAANAVLAPWTAADLEASLTSSTPGFPPPYNTTVWGFGNNGTVDYVYVISGHIPSTIELLSIPVSIPVGTV